MIHENDLDMKDHLDRTPLMRAAQDGDSARCVQLIKSGANPYLTDGTGYNAFFYAAIIGKTAMIDVFAKHAELMISQDNNGFTPLMLSVSIGDTAFIEKLLRFLSCEQNPLIKDGDDPKELVRKYVNHHAESGYTALSAACRYGHAGIAELLIRQGANPNGENPTNNTPIEIALTSTHPDCADVLARHGARMEHIKNTRPKDYQRLKTILDAFCQTLQVDAATSNPILAAARNEHVEIAKMLAEAGASITPLKEEYPDLFRLLKPISEQRQLKQKISSKQSVIQPMGL